MVHMYVCSMYVCTYHTLYCVIHDTPISGQSPPVDQLLTFLLANSFRST